MADNPFMVYKASAGSGKTYTLVKEYLKMVFSRGEEHLLGGFRSVLAITFTNKAVAEMKERIMQELQVLASEEADPEGLGMGADIVRETGIDPQALRRMAAKLHAIVLHRYSSLSVSTIDSFMTRVVRTFARDLGQPFNFDMMIDQQEIIDQAVAGLMSMVGTEGGDELAEVLVAFAESRMEEGKGYNVERSIAELAELLFSEDSGGRMAQLERLTLSDFMRLHNQYARQAKAAVERMGALAAESLGLLGQAGIGEEHCYQGQRGYYGYLSKLAAGERAVAGSYVVAAMEEGVICKAKVPEAVQRAAEDLLPRLRELYAETRRLEVEVNTCDALRANLYATALLSLLDEQMHGYERDNEVVHLSDFNKMINKVVEDEDNPAPFIFERLGDRYRHILVDEFQDTSVMQWHNLVPLVENGVSQGHASLVVGDGKQSIYRFRQGDVAQFVRLPRVEGMRHHGQSLSMPGNYSVRSLDHNHRSAAAIIDFNNSFFSHLARNVFADNAMVSDIYIGRDADGSLLPEGKEELRQLKAKEMEGYVKVEVVGEKQAAEEGFDSVKEAIYDRVLQTIVALTAERGYAYGDIVVLARNNAELAAVSAYIARHSDVPQTSTESFYLRSSHAAMAVVEVVRLVHNRADAVAAAELSYHLRCLGLVDVDPADPVAAVATPHPALDLDGLAAMGIYDCCESIVRQLSLDGIDTPYVASLLNGAAALSAAHKQTLGDFLEWFDGHEKLSAASSEGLDAVELLTIHKAKGLGKPVVICPLFEEKNHAAEIWVDVDKDTAEGDIALPTAYVRLGNDKPTRFESERRHEQMMNEVDELNVLYVAFTRPQERLYVFCPSVADKKKREAGDRRYPALIYSYAPDGLSLGDEVFMHAAKRSATQRPTVMVDRLVFADWTGKVQVASPSEKAVQNLNGDKRDFGNAAHDMLSLIGSADDVDGALERFFASHPVADAVRGDLERIARAVVKHPDTARFFAKGVKHMNECELVVDGKRLRIDRVAFVDGEPWVVDFKTGDEHPEQYHRQIAQYCSALRQMGYGSVHGCLVYLVPEVRLEMCE